MQDDRGMADDPFTVRMRAIFRNLEVPEQLRARIAAMLAVERRLADGREPGRGPPR